jgi:RNA polymerase sigma-70 factor (ECF subfamily)
VSDGDLIARARCADVHAFRALYDAHHRRVYALALRLMASRPEAEELTQDVFVAAWRQLPTYRGEGQLATWLHGIAVRLCRQRWRSLLRRWRREERYAREAYAHAVRAAIPTADVALEEALAALPARVRMALVLHAIEGYSQAETATLMGISPGTVKAHVHRARALIIERLEGGS